MSRCVYIWWQVMAPVQPCALQFVGLLPYGVAHMLMVPHYVCWAMEQQHTMCTTTHHHWQTHQSTWCGLHSHERFVRNNSIYMFGVAAPAVACTSSGPTSCVCQWRICVHSPGVAHCRALAVNGNGYCAHVAYRCALSKLLYARGVPLATSACGCRWWGRGCGIAIH